MKRISKNCPVNFRFRELLMKVHVQVQDNHEEDDLSLSFLMLKFRLKWYHFHQLNLL